MMHYVYRKGFQRLISVFFLLDVTYKLLCLVVLVSK